MSCVDKINVRNFLRWLKVDPSGLGITIEDLQANGVPAFCEVQQFPTTVIINTSWNDATANDGEFSISFYTTNASYEYQFILPNGTTQTATGGGTLKSLTIAADSGILDGTTKTITWTSEFFDQVVGLFNWNGKKLEGDLDFSAIIAKTDVVGNNLFNVQDNNITSYTSPRGTVRLVSVRDCNVSDITLLVDQWDNSVANSAFIADGNSIEIVSFTDNISNCLTISLDDNGMSIPEVNKILTDINAVARGNTARILNIDGTNGSISGSGADNGLLAVVELEAKNYTVAHNGFISGFTSISDWGDGQARLAFLSGDYASHSFAAFDTVVIAGSDGYDGVHLVLALDAPGFAIKINEPFVSSVADGKLLNETP